MLGGIVIVTSPELTPSFAIKAAFSINPVIIFGTAFGVGVNTFISNYSKGMGCRVEKSEKGYLVLLLVVQHSVHSSHFSLWCHWVAVEAGYWFFRTCQRFLELHYLYL
jgi:hypothetical protein